MQRGGHGGAGARARQVPAGIERRALRIAAIALHDHAEAEDAVQDSMIRLVRNYGRLLEDEWRPLFYRILRNRITDLQRRWKVRHALMAFWSGRDEAKDVPDPLENAVDPRGRPDEALEGEELLARIEEALESLSSRQREAFLLRNFEGLDVAEAAGTAPCDPAPPGNAAGPAPAAAAALRTRIRRTTVGGLFPRCLMRRSSARMTG